MQNIKDTYQRIKDAVIEQLEAGTKPWIRPWRGNSRGSLVPRRAAGEAYRGINLLMLWLASELAGYEENTWMTYRQAQDLGGQVRKGEKGALVVKYGTFAPKEREDDDDRSIPYLKATQSSTWSRSRTFRWASIGRPLSSRQRRYRIFKTSKRSSATPVRRSHTAERPPAIGPQLMTSSYQRGSASWTKFISIRRSCTSLVTGLGSRVALTAI